MAKRPSRRSARTSESGDSKSARGASSRRRDSAKATSARSGSSKRRSSRERSSEGRATTARTSKRDSKRTTGSDRSRNTGRMRKSSRSSSRTDKTRSQRDSNPSPGRRSRRDQGRESAPAKGKGKTIHFVLAGAAGVLLLLGLILYGPIRRGMLLDQLKSQDANTRATAINGLLQYGSSATPGLRQIVLGTRGDAPYADASRADAAYGLALIPEKRTTTMVSSLATGESDDLPEDEAGKIRLWLLSGILRAQTAANYPAETFLANATAESDLLRELAAKGLAAFRGDVVTTTLIELLKDKDGEVSTAGGQALRQAARGEDAGELAKLLKEEDKHVRSVARDILIEKADATALATLGNYLASANDELALEILAIFDHHAHQPAASKQIANAIDHRSLKVANTALTIAGKRQLGQTYDAILQAANSDNADKRVAAVRAIEMSTNLSLTRKIEGHLKDPDPRVRVAAIEAHYKNGNGTTSVIGQFINMLDDENADVGRKALEALKTIKGRYRKQNGDDRNAWKRWWEIYQEQMAVVDRAEEAVKQAAEWNLEQDNASYDKAIELTERTMAEGDKLLQRSDLVLELKSKDERHRMRLERALKALREQRYTAKKHKTL